MNRDDITYEIVSFAEYYSKFYNEELAWKLAVRHWWGLV